MRFISFAWERHGRASSGKGRNGRPMKTKSLRSWVVWSF